MLGRSPDIGILSIQFLADGRREILSAAAIARHKQESARIERTAKPDLDNKLQYQAMIHQNKMVMPPYTLTPNAPTTLLARRDDSSLASAVA
jgi:hypothetical protein